MAATALATYREAIKIVVICIFWYASSSANNICGKIILNDFPYPMTVSMVQLLSITLYTIPMVKLWSIPAMPSMASSTWLTLILPLALAKFFNSVSSHVSLWKVPVSYAHTVKATMPFFTVILSRIILRQKQTNMIYASLAPIIFGVILATLTELSFNTIGLVCALASTMGLALQNIYSKKCLQSTGLHHLRLLHLLAFIACILFTPIWFFFDFFSIVQGLHLNPDSHILTIVALLVVDGFCNFCQNLMAFTVIAMVSPLSYAVANATKRIVIVTVSLAFLRNPVTLLNVVGMMTAIFGVLCYNKAKYDQNVVLKKSSILPISARNGRNHSNATSLLLEGFQNHSNKRRRR